MEKILNDEKVKAQKQKEEYEKSQSRLDELEEGQEITRLTAVRIYFPDSCEKCCETHVMYSS